MGIIYSNLNQNWWNNTVFATGYVNVGGNNQVEGIKTFFKDGMNKIRMAAHLTARDGKRRQILQVNHLHAGW